MRRHFVGVLVFLVLGMSPLAGAADKAVPLESTSPAVAGLLKQGAEQMEARAYQDALKSFEQAIQAEPGSVEAKLGVANACMRLWVTDRDAPNRESYYFRARNTLLDVLDQEPENQKALRGMARMSLQRAISARDLKTRPESLDEARSWNVRLIGLDPNATSAHYALGVIAWTRCLGPESQSRNPQNLPPSDSDLPPAERARLTYRTVCQGPIEEGIWHLNQALAIEKDNDAVMGYLSALYGMKAGYEESVEDSKRDRDLSAQWSAKAESVKKAKFAATSGGPNP